MDKRFFTSESVTEGHPDKVCDQIADAILDDIYAEDNSARVAIEVCATTGMVMVLGEVSTDHYSDIPAIVRGVIKDIGYDDSSLGFDYKTCAVISSLDEQSPDIAQGVDSATDSESEEDEFERQGAGDQGMMFGYATDETEEYMPLPIVLAHALTARLTEARKNGEISYLRPDGKAQVTVEYVDGVPERVDTIVVSSQHSEDVDMADLEKDIIEKVIKVAIPQEYFDEDTKIYVNPTGRFVVGGPMGDTGVTGRKIIVDTYGGMCRHGGGALSGKDPSKVDRSGLYMTRYICKNLVAAGVARRLEVQVAYAIGMSHPVAVYADSYGTGVISDDKIVDIINEVFDLRPRAIIKKLGLDRPIYRESANYGHLGRNIFPWEKLDKVEEIKEKLARI
ncbi:MAG: methionine adenosyltransferase [Clostridia bacterium]|nr:methionine adenosyltransferase [Clostridia bacterium]MBO5982387.1 methionine adenosyltransferase [Clostridia bacterium]MBO7151319.1 methionine adenosyltransferase [Clostridia bacterium]MBO7221939.1 methionine adenosyltransferase [Clostridia bacterium]MBO7326366.1 methionine adenosyltransferase [Clostridia bacterium]